MLRDTTIILLMFCSQNWFCLWCHCSRVTSPAGVAVSATSAWQQQADGFLPWLALAALCEFPPGPLGNGLQIWVNSSEAAEAPASSPRRSLSEQLNNDGVEELRRYFIYLCFNPGQSVRGGANWSV